MLHPPLVEAVYLELEAVEAKVVEEVPLKDARGRVGDAPTAKVRMNGKAAEIRDAIPAAPAREAHRARTLAVDLDHEQAEELRLRRGALDVGEDAVTVVRPRRGEIRLDLLMGDELDDEVEVVGVRAPDVDRQTGSSSGLARRAEDNTRPDPSATPSRIKPRPASIATVTGSERNTAP